MRRYLHIISAQFCAMQYINYPRYIEDEKDEATRWKGKERRKADVQFVDVCTGNHPLDLCDVEFMGTISVRNIKKGEELFVEYGSSYNFPSSTKN